MNRDLTAFGAFARGYEKVCRAILLVFVINVAIVAHTLLGIVVAGFFPSIAAGFSTYRSWLLDSDREWSVKQTWMCFHRVWKQELISANQMGWALAAAWALLGYSMFLVLSNDMGVAGYASSGLLLLAVVILSLLSLMVWAVRANFAETNRWAAHVAMVMIIARPACSLLLIAVAILAVLATFTWPGILAAFGLSLPIGLTQACVWAAARLPGMSRQTTTVSQQAQPAALSTRGVDQQAHSAATAPERRGN